LGTTEKGKKIQAFKLDGNGQVVDDSIFLDYIGSGRATVIGVAFGPDGLYFTDLWGENGFDEFGQTQGNVYRIRWHSDDATAPVISNVQADLVGDGSATIVWQTDEPAKRQVEYGANTSYGNWTAYEKNLSTSHTVTLRGLAPGAYHFRVWSWDAVNNGAVSGDFTFTIGLPDTIPPVISNVFASNLTASGAAIIWNTDEPSDSQVEYGLNTNYGSTSPLDANRVTSHSVTLSGLAANTTYHYRVKSKDASGNSKTSADFTFTTPGANFYLQRVNAGGSSYTSNGKIWDADKAYANGSWGYQGGKTSTSGDAIANTTDDVLYQSERWGLTAYRFTVPASGRYRVELHFAENYFNAAGQRVFDVLIENTLVLDDLDIHAAVGHDVALVRTFEVEVTDGVLDISFGKVIEDQKISAIEVVSVSTDQTPPVISNVAAGNLTTTSATITWNTNELSNSQVEYGLTTNYGSATPVDPQLLASHSLLLSGLQANTTYHYRVKSKDAAGNLATSGDFSFTTLSPAPPLTFNPTQDADVKSSFSATNYGANPSLRLRDGSVKYNSYLKFEVTGLGGPVQSARLRLYVTEGSDDGGTVYAVSNNYEGSVTPWDENGITWDNAPAIGSTPLSNPAGAVIVDTWVELDVTSAITGNGIYSFGILNHSTSTGAYSSKEGSNPPELVIQTTSGSDLAAKTTDQTPDTTGLGDDHIATSFPDRIVLYPNYPNPLRVSASNAQTKIVYQLPQRAQVTLALYDLLGRELKIFVDNAQEAGTYHVSWDGRDDNGILVPSGVYVYRLRVGHSVSAKTLVIVR
jgi:hypothetical protein